MVKATNHYVILKLEKVKNNITQKGNLLMVNQKDKYKAIVYDIGPDVKKDINFKIGDNVVFNEYDKKVIEIDDTLYIIVQDKSIMAILDNDNVIMEAS